MSASAGVPAWARPVLEALETLANISADMTMGHVQPVATRLSDAWEGMRAACAAALAAASGPDAGTGEGPLTGHFVQVCICGRDDGPCPMHDPLPEMSFTASAPASGAAPEARDGELEALIGDLERLAGPGKTLQWRDVAETMTIGEKLRSLVARREQAAREAGRREGMEDAAKICQSREAAHGLVEAANEAAKCAMAIRRTGRQLLAQVRLDAARRRGKEEG